jgi:predicted dehydrogenase
VKPSRLAVIGVGHLGAIHARKLRDMAGVELAAIVDPCDAARDRLAAELGVPAVADYRDILDRVDGAVLAAPTRMHHAIGLTCLRRGIHLLIEKPLATTAAEADDLVDAARRGGAVLQVGHVERFNPAFVAARGQLSGPKFIQAERLGTFAGRSTDIGTVLDLMIHDIDLALTLAEAPVVGVEALGIALLGPREDVAHARLVFRNGCLAVLSASRVSFRAARSMQVWSADGFAGMDFMARSASVARPCQAIRDQQYDVDALPPAERLAVKDHLFQDLLPVEQLPVESRDAIGDELEDFLASIRGQRTPRVGGDQGRDAVRVAEMVLEAIASHSWSGNAAGPFGARIETPPQTIPAPHFGLRQLEGQPQSARKEAG